MICLPTTTAVLQPQIPHTNSALKVSITSNVNLLFSRHCFQSPQAVFFHILFLIMNLTVKQSPDSDLSQHLHHALVLKLNYTLCARRWLCDQWVSRMSLAEERTEGNTDPCTAEMPPSAMPSPLSMKNNEPKPQPVQRTGEADCFDQRWE